MKNLLIKKKEELKKITKSKNQFIEKAKSVNNKVLLLIKKVKKMVNCMAQLNQKKLLMKLKKDRCRNCPSQIDLKNDLNKIGKFDVSINFHSEVKALIHIKIDKIKSK